MMPYLDLTITVASLLIDYRIVYSAEPVMPRTEESPEEDGIILGGVECIGCTPQDAEPFPQETLEAIQDELLAVLRGQYSEAELRAMCAADWRERVLAGMET